MVTNQLRGCISALLLFSAALQAQVQVSYSEYAIPGGGNPSLITTPLRSTPCGFSPSARVLARPGGTPGWGALRRRARTSNMRSRTHRAERQPAGLYSRSGWRSLVHDCKFFFLLSLVWR